jgi:hypothetical protein
MIRRRPSRPVLVEKRAITGSSPRRATPDRGRIRSFHADDTEAREEEAFSRLSKAEQMNTAITAWVDHYRGVNDPDRQRELAISGVASDLAEAATSHKQYIDDKRDPRIIVRPKPGEWGNLKRADQMRSAATRHIHTNPKMPGRMGWWHYLKDLRKRSPESGA